MIVGGRYELTRLIGKGGMGEVHEAFDRETKRRVAVKRLRVADGAPPELIARFRREVLAMAQITSRHAVAIHDAGRDDATGEPYMVMDLLEGEDLAALARRMGTLPVPFALRLAAQACEGLVAAHALGIVHRDIKPGNLFLVAGPRARIVKVLDFGIARVTTSGGDLTELTRTGAIVGSPAYMAPEQLRGSHALDHRADVWSLGVVLYRLLAGATPHGRHEGIAELMFAICSEPAPPLRERAPWVPEDVAALVHRALEIEVDRRLPSARDFAAELAALSPEGMAITDEAIARWCEQHPLTRAATTPEAPPRDESEAPPVSQTRAVRAAQDSQRLAPPGLPRVAAPVAVVAPRPPFPLGVILAALFMVAGVGAAIYSYRRHRDRPDREVPAPTEMVTSAEETAETRKVIVRVPVDRQPPLPKDLIDTDGARWFMAIRERCTSLEVAALLRDRSPPNTRDGKAFAAGCAALAGQLDLARTWIERMPKRDRRWGVWPMFELVHPAADARATDLTVAAVMRLVVDYWGDNAMALYHAGITEYLVEDRRARAHLTRFLELYRTRDGFHHTATVLLAELTRPSGNCALVLATDPEGHHFRPIGCNTASPP